MRGIKKVAGGAVAVLAVAAVVAFAVQTDAAAGGDVATLARDNNAFAIDLYRHISKQESGNVFISPLGASTALSMVYAGAKNETAAEMAKVLHISAPDTLHASYAGLMARMNDTKSAYTLKMANALWVSDALEFNAPFLKTVHDAYRAEADGVDFAQKETVVRKVNDWASDRTAGKIKDVISTDSIDRETIAILTNAIYFKGDWATAFKKSATREETFHTPAGPVTAPLMWSKATYGYAEESGLQALAMPYKSAGAAALSMVVLLPRAGDDLAGLEESLTSPKLQTLFEQLGKGQQEVNVTLPKFKFTRAVMLTETLKGMGMTRPFDKVKADFTGMVTREVQGNDRNVYISGVLQKAFVDVNEEGTEAAAVTVVSTGMTAMSFTMEPPVPVFRADRPFIFMICDMTTGSILFMGRVTDPLSL